MKDKILEYLTDKLEEIKDTPILSYDEEAEEDKIIKNAEESLLEDIISDIKEM